MQDLKTNTIKTYRKGPSTLALILGVGAMLSAATPAMAQIDEVVTTAQRRSQSLQDVPVAVTVINAEALETKQINGTTDIQNFVPNLNIGTNTGTANGGRIFLRGIGEDESRGAVEPAVGTYIDGVYVGRAIGTLIDLVDIEQVEVLRGPQGTLYGRNSNGGAIKITSVKPQDTQAFSAKATYGNNERFDLKGMANLPITDTTAVRVSAMYKTRDGFFDIIPNGVAAGERRNGVGALDSKAFRAALSQDIGDWNVLLSADYIDDNSDPIPSSIFPGVAGDDTAFTIEPAGTCTSSSQTPIGAFDFRPVGCYTAHSSETKSRGLSATVTGNIGNYDVQSITSFRRLDDNLQSHIGYSYAQVTDQEQISQELTVSSNYQGPFNFVAGGYYFKEDLNLDSFFVYPFSIASDVESVAVFGQANYDISDRATFTAGIRYTDEKRDHQGINRTSNLTSSGEINDDRVSFSTKLDYDLTNNIMVYGSYATGYKGGGFSPDCFGPAGCFLPVDEEKVATMEFGVKSRLLENSLNLNTTYFNNNYDNLQIAASVAGLGFTRFNVDETKIQGVEIEMLFQPTDRFDFSANVGLLDAKYKSLTLQQASGLTNGGQPCPGGVVTVECALNLGLKNAPDYKINLAATYKHPLSMGELAFSGDINFEDDSFNLVANAPVSALSEIPTLINGRIAFKPKDSFWNVAVWAKNILDKEYYRASTATGFAVYASEPATYGIDFGINF